VERQSYWQYQLQQGYVVGGDVHGVQQVVDVVGKEVVVFKDGQRTHIHHYTQHQKPLAPRPLGIFYHDARYIIYYYGEK
jgi:hypothetical protein